MNIEMLNISKTFGSLKALDGVSITIKSGEVLGLLGENGAGKSTLMNILFGLYRMDSGEIRIDGKPVKISSPKDAIEKGIFMVHQQFKLIPSYTALENIVINMHRGLGSLTRRNPKAERETVEKILRSLNFEVPLDRRVDSLSLGTQQKIEILKALVRGARVLILDEPTTNLTPGEVDELFQAIKRLKENGVGIVFITHKLREVLEITDRIVILRKGRKVGERITSAVSPSELIELMVGARMESIYPELQPTKGYGEIVLAVRDLWLVEGGLARVRGVSLSIRRGEIYGIAGVAGNGQSELMDLLIGYRRPSKGYIELEGREITVLNPLERISLGLRFIPEDRVRDGVLPSMPIYLNAILGDHRAAPYSRGVFLDMEAVRERALRIVKTLRVDTPSIYKIAGRLSGGNLQKLIVGRALDTLPKVLIAYSPTRGLDLATSRYVLERIVELREKGVAVLYIGEDLDELLSISDRLSVIYKGELMGELERSRFSKDLVGKMMAGYRLEEVAG
ncbi:MAG: ABC transporter ATP-binding protein [Sulfolobales archaeon]